MHTRGVGERDADGFPRASAENAGTLYTDPLTGRTWVCDLLSDDEREALAGDLEVDGALYAWRPLRVPGG